MFDIAHFFVSFAGTGSYIFIVGAYGFFHWRAHNFRLTFIPILCFLSCGGVLIVMQLSLTYVILKETYSTFAIFMLYSVVPAMLNAYLNQYKAPYLSFAKFLKLSPNDEVKNIIHTIIKNIKNVTI